MSTGRLTLPGRTSKGPRRQRSNRTLLLFLLPALAIYGVFLAVPAVAALAMSLTNWKGAAGGNPSFVGLIVITSNNLLFPLLFLRTDANKASPLLEFRGQYLTDYLLLFSGVIVATTPIVIAYLFLQRYFIEGMTAGSVKG